MLFGEGSGKALAGAGLVEPIFRAILALLIGSCLVTKETGCACFTLRE
jgi:hypothetical protein